MAQADSSGLTGGALPLLPALEWPVLVAAAAVNLLALALPLVTLQIYDRVLPYAAWDTLHALALMLVVAFLVDGGLKAARAYVAGWAGARFEHRLANATVDRLLAAPVSEIEKVAPGEQLDRLAAVEPLREFHANQGPGILVDLPFAAVFLGLLWLIGGAIVLVPLGLLAVFAALALLIGDALRRAAAGRATLEERRYSFLIEIFSGIHTIKALGFEPMMVRRYERLLDSAAIAAQRNAALGGHAQSLGGLFGQLATAGTVLVGAAMVIGGELTVGGLAACTMLAGRALQPLMKAMGVWTYFQSIRVARDRLNAMLALAPERAAELPAIGALEGRIRLDRVSFAYPGGAPLFDGIDLELGPGETVAIVGGNGTGKSTLLNLIGGTLAPTSGRVLHDGVDVLARNASSLRRQIAHLPQQGALFKGTILQNLTQFRTGAAADDAVRLATALGLDQPIARQPQGFETKVAHGAQDALPGGVRQRIAVIRALVGSPPVILFDEANVALDGDSDEKLRQLLASYKGRRTMVLVSYRPSILKLADRVLKIEGGRLVAMARPDQLQPAPGVVARKAVA